MARLRLLVELYFHGVVLSSSVYLASLLYLTTFLVCQMTQVSLYVLPYKPGHYFTNKKHMFYNVSIAVLRGWI